MRDKPRIGGASLVECYECEVGSIGKSLARFGSLIIGASYKRIVTFKERR